MSLWHWSAITSEPYNKIKTFFLESNGQLHPHKATQISINKNIARVHFENTNDMNAALLLVKRKVYLPLKDLPKLDKTKVFFHDIVGYLVVDAHHGELGTIGDIIEMPQQAIAKVMKGNKEILFPLNKDFIEKVDHKEKKIFVSLPEGLVDIYLA